MRFWKRLVAVGAVAASLVIGGLVVWPIGNHVAEITLTGDVQRGAYLARASGCIACHTDFEGGGAPLAGGVKLDTPFGAIYSVNLTTDPEFGIGDWSIEEFAKAVRQGISPTGEPYYPAFTYAFYADFTDQDIADMWAAFQTVPPVAEPAPEHEMPFPFDQRWGLKLWRAAFLRPPATDPIPGNGDIWNRGRELVGGATHCAACHTARNFLGGRKSHDGHFAGNPRLPGGSKAPAIDYRTLQSNGWSVDTLAYALETGIMPDGDTFGGSMSEVVSRGTRFLTPDDRQAIAIYLMDDHDGG
jgi:mono/diheme cytochrome c family protein